MRHYCLDGAAAERLTPAAQKAPRQVAQWQTKPDIAVPERFA
jgi:hypothetical protein